MKTLAQLVVPFLVKAEDIDKDARTFSGLAAVWDKDLGDDIIHKGAFKNTIKEWKAGGDAMPLINSHNHWDIMSAIGQAIKLEETAEGLLSTWEVIEGEDGDKVLARLRPSKRTGRAAIGKMSIGYEPVKYDFEQSDASRFGQIRHLREVSLKEVSLVIFPMAPGASIDVTSVKSFAESLAHTDAQTVSVETKQELRRLNSRIGNLLAKTKSAVEDDPPEAPAPPSSAGDPPPAPSPTPAVPVSSTPAAPVELTPTGDPVPSASPDPLAPPAPTSEQKTEPPVYLYSDALQQRLSKVLLTEKVSRITNPFREVT